MSIKGLIFIILSFCGKIIGNGLNKFSLFNPWIGGMFWILKAKKNTWNWEN